MRMATFFGKGFGIILYMAGFDAIPRIAHTQRQSPLVRFKGNRFYISGTRPYKLPGQIFAEPLSPTRWYTFNWHPIKEPYSIQGGEP